MHSPLRILIIGGSGFLSGTVARAAVAKGHHVTIITRGQKPAPAGVEVVLVDRENRAAFAEKVAELNTDWDLVVDAIPYTPDDALQDVAVFSGRTRRLAFVSTDFVYDPAQRIVPQPEEVATYATDGYGGKKRHAEIILQQTDPTTLAWTILRPSHIYGPGSLPGCLPLHGRDPLLVERIQQEKPLALVSAGRFLQHPIFAPDLAEIILNAATNSASIGKTLNVAGPEILESSEYYRVLGKILEHPVSIKEIPVAEFLAAYPEKAPFCCDRVYDLAALKDTGLPLPATSLETGMRYLLET